MKERERERKKSHDHKMEGTSMPVGGGDPEGKEEEGIDDEDE